MKRGLVLLILVLPAFSIAQLNPIAKIDVVPYQRITEPFNFGVVAFSKAGIDRVEFEITGLSYTGGTKISNETQLNNRLEFNEPTVSKASWPGVWEYYVTIDPDEFTGEGEIMAKPTVYGIDGGIRELEPVTMFIKSQQADIEAWVSPNGDDNTAEVQTQDRPFATINSAVQAAQAANGGISDGNIIYLEEGTYTLEGQTPTTVNEWLTIRNSPGAGRDNVIIDNGGAIDDTSLFKIQGVTLYSGGDHDYVIRGDGTKWVHGCKLTSIGRHHPSNCGDPCVHPLSGESYVTDTLAYNVDRAVNSPKLVRNLVAHKTSEDIARNSGFLVNIRVDDNNNGDIAPGCWHNDGYQNFLRPMNNEIVYNYYGTDMHCQGLFIRITDVNGGGDDVAFVNIFMEMRQPGNKGTLSNGECTGPRLTSGALYFDSNEKTDWNHLLMWHNSFPTATFSMYVPNIMDEIKDSSFIGNVFYGLKDGNRHGGSEIGQLEFGNGQGNEALYNHYIGAVTLTLDEGCHSFHNAPEGCPPFNTKAPDSSKDRSAHTHGGMLMPQVLDLIDNINYENFGYPTDSEIIDSLPQSWIPADVFGYPRDEFPDKGSIEYVGCNKMTHNELIGFIEFWKSGAININQVMQSISQWKRGC